MDTSSLPRIAATGILGLGLSVGLGCDSKQGSVGDDPSGDGKTTDSDPGGETSGEDSASQVEWDCSGALTFDDPGFEAEVREFLGGVQGDIVAADVAGLTFVGAYASDIASIGGAQCLTSLTGLALDGNQITDLTPLTGLTNLSNLTLDDNQITDLAPLTGLTNLTALTLDGNQVHDIAPLASLTELRELNARDNEIADLTPLAGLSHLKDVQLDQNEITVLPPMAGLSKLAFLNVRNNQITDLSPLADLPQNSVLTILGLTNNQITDISSLAVLADHATTDTFQLLLAGNPLDHNACCMEIPALVTNAITVTLDNACDPYPGCL